jgi:AraC-like DNA-binding protein
LLYKKSSTVANTVSVFELIRALRMQYAEAHLKDKGQTVSEVAYQLGYEHVQHFSAAFKEHHRHSPKHSKTELN